MRGIPYVLCERKTFSMTKDVAFSNNFGAFKTLKKLSNLTLAYSHSKQSLWQSFALLILCLHLQSNLKSAKAS